MKSVRNLHLCLLDTYPEPMRWDKGRGKEFREVFQSFPLELEWERIHYTDLIGRDRIHSAEWQKVLSADGLVLSGSSFNLSEEQVRDKFEPIAELIRRYEKPILGICFGHQLIAHSFGFPVRPMRPEYLDSELWEHTKRAAQLPVRPGFPLIEEESIWVEFSHHEEIVESKEFHRVFEVYASTEACRIQVMAHRQRPIYGVQFHPETGKDPRARRDGQKIFERFVRQITAT